MSDYTVYRAGDDEPASGPPSLFDPAQPRPDEEGLRKVYRSDAPSGRRWVLWVLVAAAVAAAAVLFWLYGRDSLGNAQAAYDIVRTTGKVPGWALITAPVVMLLVVALVSMYVAFGRLTVLKVVGLVLVVVALAAPGAAVGWANGTVSTVGNAKGGTVQHPFTGNWKDPAKDDLPVPLPGKAVNILLIGSDKSQTPGDPGRSDTQILLRLDPATKSISMLSLPRDLRVNIPGVGYDKMNAAYAYGGPDLVIKTFSQLTGLPINHYVMVNFAGFWHAVNIVGGVYVPIDHHYFNPQGTGWKSIHIQPGYQLLDGKNALDFVRFRHDQLGDFTRMQRQQLFIKELQRQSSRWSGDWAKVLKIIKAVTQETTSDIDSLRKLQPLVELAFQVNTSKVYQVHVEGSTPMINGVSYVEATPAEIAQAVAEFKNPVQAPVKATRGPVRKKDYSIEVYNSGAPAGYATAAALQLSQLGYQAQSLGNAPEVTGKVTVIYAPKDLSAQAQQVGAMMWPSDVRLVDRAPGVTPTIRVFAGSSFGGQITVPQAPQQPKQTVVKQRYAASQWRTLQKQTHVHLMMPTVWSPGLAYDQFRAYSIAMSLRKGAAHKPAAVAVGVTPTGSYFDIQAMRWSDPPAISSPNSSQVVRGTKYLLFYQADHLHMVAWQAGGTTYWVVNSFDNALSNDLMMALATSSKPVK